MDPLGGIVVYGGDEETLLLGDIDLSKVSEIRSSMPFLKDRRTDPLD